MADCIFICEADFYTKHELLVTGCISIS